MENLNENIGGEIENEFQDWLDMMYTDKDYPEIETLETVIDYAQDTLRDYRADYTVFESKNRKMENLNEGKKKKMSYMAELAEIDKQSAIVAMEAKINKLAEMIEAKTTRLSMVSEDENLSELIDKRRVKEMQKEIKILEKEKSKMEKMYEKMHGGKKKEVVKEEDPVDEGGYGMSNYEEDGMKEEVVAEEEIDEAHCSEEDDLKEEKEETNEEVNRWQKLAGISLQENKIAQAIRDEAKQPDSKVGAAIFKKYAKKIESAPKGDYRKILTSMERELIDKHPDTFDGDDDIVASFMAAK